MTLTFTAPDIECSGCAASIKKALGQMPGIVNASVDLPAKVVTVQANEQIISSDRIAEALAEVGFPPSPKEAAQARRS